MIECTSLEGTTEEAKSKAVPGLFSDPWAGLRILTAFLTEAWKCRQ